MKSRACNAVSAVSVALTLLLVPAAPKSPLCDSGTYRKAHPLICDTGAAAPGTFPGAGGGGGGGGGLLGAIGDVIGGLTGGLL
jgi:hypothetical protein